MNYSQINREKSHNTFGKQLRRQLCTAREEGKFCAYKRVNSDKETDRTLVVIMHAESREPSFTADYS